MSFNFGTMTKFAVYFEHGVIYTVLLSACTVLLGFLLALGLALMRIAKPGRSTASKVLVKVLHLVSGFYIEVIRGTPMLVQLFIIYYIAFGPGGLTAPKFTLFGFINGEQFIPGIVALSLNSGAYVAEICRAGIMSIDIGQLEAGRSIGFSYAKTMWYIILPQAFKNVLPALGNEFIVLLKETSVSGYIALHDLTKGGDVIRSRTYDAFMPLIGVALIYLAMVLGFTKLVSMLERRLNQSER